MNSIALNLSEGFLLELVLKGALLMGIAFAITLASRRASAAFRHAVWSLAFIGLLLLPLGATLLPSWHVPTPEVPHLNAVVPSSDAPRTTLSAEAAVDMTSSEMPAGEASSAVASAASTPQEIGSVVQQSSTTASWPWMEIGLFVWFSVAAWLLVRLALVHGKLSLLRRRSSGVRKTEWTELAADLSAEIGITRSIRLLEHEEITVPMTYGLYRPVIFLPLHAASWSREEARVTLMHELMHVKRCDHLVHVLALCARALHWFNPLTWAATKRLVLERERACDDAVLSMGVASTSYADHLLGVARYVLSGREASVAALPMARASDLRTRIVAILDPAQPHKILTGLPMTAMAACAVVLVLSLSAMQAAPVEDQEVVPAVTQQVKTIADGVQEEFAAVEAEPEPDRQIAAEVVADEPVDTTDVEAQRRAIHAISELDSQTSIPLLTDIARTHRSPKLREEAIFWLGETGDGSVVELLESFATNDTDEGIQKKAIFALSEVDDDRGLPALGNLARTHSNPDIRSEAVFWLGEAGGPEAADELARIARNDASPNVQRKAVFALSELDDSAGVEHLVDLARSHADSEVREEAVFWLGETGDPRAADVLMDIVNGN